MRWGPGSYDDKFYFWFAWWPVFCEEDQCWCWLETVMRRRIFGVDSKYEYRKYD